MHYVKRVALWSLGLLLFSAVIVTAFLAIAGDNFYRWAAGRLLEGSIDRTIHFDGTFSFDVTLEPTLIVTDVWLENAPWAEKAEMARVERAEVQVALKPLFSGIVRLPRLVVDGLTLDLETGPDGAGNWEVASASYEDEDTAGQKDMFYPLVEFISLKDVAITYRDRQSGRDTEIFLRSLQKDRIAGDSGFAIQGEGRLNQGAFRIKGRFGSLEDALAATAPYPLELTLDSSGLVVELKGTAQNLPHAEGFDMNLTARAPSIGQVLETWESDLALEGRVEASARLKGDLETLSVENFALQIVEQSGQELHAEGSLSNLWNGQGLDLQFSGKLGPQALRPLHDLPHELSEILNGVAQLDIAGQIKGDLETPAFEDLDAQLKHRSGAVISLQGHAALDFSGVGMAFTELEAKTTLFLPGPALLEQALGTELPDLGAIHAASELSRADDSIILRSFKAEATSFAGLQLSAKGRIGNVSGTGFELDPRLDFSTSIKHSKPLVSLFAQPAKEAEPPSEGSPDNLVLLVQQGLETLGLHPGPEDGLMGPRTRAAIEAYQSKHNLSIDGQATEELLHRLQRETDSDSKPAVLEADDGQSRASNFVEALPELGPIMASGRLTGRNGTYRLDGLRFTIGAKNTLWIEASGALETLRPQQDNPLDGVMLKVTFALPSSKVLSQLIPPEVPELKNITGHFDVEGSPEALAISKARIEAVGPEGLAGVAAGRVGRLSLVPSFAARDLAVELEVSAPSTEGLSQFVGFHLPELGAIRAKAALRDRGDLFSVTGIDASAGPEEKPAVHVTGEIGNLLALKQVAVSGNFEVPIARLLGPDISIEKPSLGEVRGKFDLSDADGSMGFEKLNAETINTDLFSLSAEGVFDDLVQRDELKFQASLKIPDPSTLGRRIGFDVEGIGALSYAGRVSGSDEQFSAEGKAQVGQTEISGTLSGSFKDARPVLRAKLTSPVFHFADFGLRPDAEAEKVDQKRKKTKQRLFSGNPIPFEALKDFDLDLDVLFDQLEGVDLDINKAEARLDLKDGLLKVDPLRFNFEGGLLQVNFLVDARPKAPTVSLKVTADDVDLGDLLAQIEADVPLDGELDLLANLQAAGTSPQALSSSLKGNLDLAIERGHIRTSLLDLAAEDLVSWMISDTARKGYSDLNCLIARFDFHDGVAESKKLILLDTAHVLALGTGSIDLGDEIIDIKVHPHAKKRRFIETTIPFTIKGPLASPSVKVSSAGATVRMVEEVLLTPVRLLENLLPLVNDHGKDAKNPCLTLHAGAPAG